MDHNNCNHEDNKVCSKNNKCDTFYDNSLRVWDYNNYDEIRNTVKILTYLVCAIIVFKVVCIAAKI